MVELAFLRDKRVLLASFIIVGMVLYLGYRVQELSTDIDLDQGSINFKISQSGMVSPEDILVFSRTGTDKNTYQVYELQNGAEIRPIDITEHEESIKTDAQISYGIFYTYDLEPLTNEALYFKTEVSSSQITIEEVSIYSISSTFIRKYEQEPKKSDTYSIFLLTTDLEGIVDGGIYLQYKGYVMEGLNKVEIILSVYIQIIEGASV
jgi:hypothetical protein